MSLRGVCFLLLSMGLHFVVWAFFSMPSPRREEELVSLQVLPRTYQAKSKPHQKAQTSKAVAAKGKSVQVKDRNSEASATVQALPSEREKRGFFLSISYPLLSLRYREEGRVQFRLKLSGKGEVFGFKQIRSSGYPRLDHAAHEALEKLRVKDGGEQSFSENLLIDFRLKGSRPEVQISRASR